MNPEIRTQITKCLEDAGFKFGNSWGVTHGEGLQSGVAVDPDSRVTADGAETIIVTANSIQRYAIRSPWSMTSWFRVGSAVEYKNPEDLVSKLKTMSTGEKGCWA
jgi:hypothetical protein